MSQIAKVQERERMWLETTARGVLARPFERRAARVPAGQAGTPPRPVVMVKVADIVAESPLQFRQEKFDPDGCIEDRELLRSIQEHGVLEPVMLVSKPSAAGVATYQVVFGHRRVSAARLTGLREVPAMIAAEDDDVGVLTLAENVGGRPLTAYEKAVGLVRLAKMSPGVSQERLAERAGISQPMVSNLLGALSASPPPLLKLFSGGMDARAVLELQPTFAKMTPAKQEALADQIRGLSRRDVKDVVRQLELGASQSAAVRVTVQKRKIAKKRGKAHRPVPEANSRAAEAVLPPDEAAQRSLAEYTGADPRAVRILFQNPKAKSAGRDALTLACAFLARGGSDHDLLGVAMSLASDRRVAEIALSHLRLQKQGLAYLARMREGPRTRLLSTILFKVPSDVRIP